MNPYSQILLTVAAFAAVALILAVGLGPALVLIAVLLAGWMIRRDEN